jgi:hypothetical protein
MATTLPNYAEGSSIDRLPLNIEMMQRIYLEEKRCAEFEEIVGDSPALKTALNLVSIVAPTDSNVVIVGEQRCAWSSDDGSQRVFLQEMGAGSRHDR